MDQQQDLIHVALPAELYSELILRVRGELSLRALIADVIGDFLDRTREADLAGDAR